MQGTPCFSGTRVPVQSRPDYIEEGDTLDNFMTDLTTVTRKHAILFLEIGKQQLIECVSSWMNASIPVFGTLLPISKS